MVLPSRRGKNKYTRQNHATPAAPSQRSQTTNPSKESDPSHRGSQGERTPEVVIQSTASNGEAGVVPVCVTFDEDSNDDGTEQRQLTEEDANRQEGGHAPPEAYDGLLTPGITTEPSEKYHSPTATVPLPAFIIPLSPRIPSEDIEFLTRKGAFQLPEPDLQLEILRSYLFSVHPFLPLLDSQDLISVVLNNGEQGNVSLLLFQAVMFGGLHSLRPSIVHRLGFETTKQAREIFFNRVRLLHDFNVEPNSVAVCQALLLMSSWYSRRHDRRDTWHWTGLAYDVARSIGLHREPARGDASDRCSHLRKRLWWSLYIRDRMIGLGTRRPMRIRDDECNVKMLTLSDFDISTFDGTTEQTTSLTPSSEEMCSTARMCIRLAKLSICIGHVVSSQYTTLDTQLGVPHTMMVVSRRDRSALEELEMCNKELDEWYRDHNENAERSESLASGRDPQSCSEIHWTILHLTYFTTVNVLHRAQALYPSLDDDGTQAAQRSSRTKVKDAARGMTKITLTMLNNDQARFLGLIGVTAIIAACLSHMLDISSSDEDVRDASTLRLYQSMQVLQYLRGIYASADAAASFVASMTGRAGIYMPAQATKSGAEKNYVGDSGRSSSFARTDPKTQAQSPNTFSSGASGQSKPSKGSRQSRAAHDLHTVPLGDDSGSMDTVRPDHRLAPMDSLTATIPGSSPSTFGPQREVLHSNHIAPEQDIFQIDTTFAGPWYSTDGPPHFDWNNHPEAGLDFGPMSFNYDFSSDTFGLLDAHNRNVQQY